MSRRGLVMTGVAVALVLNVAALGDSLGWWDLRAMATAEVRLTGAAAKGALVVLCLLVAAVVAVVTLLVRDWLFDVIQRRYERALKRLTKESNP